MKKVFYLLIFIVVIKQSIAQNLVPNPSFEDTTGCATNVWPNLACKDWFPGQFSPDYYSNSYSCLAGVYPMDYQSPRTGLSYVGFYFWQPFGCIREYISVKLTQPLVAGTSYCLQFYFSRHEAYDAGTNRVGAYFSVDTAYINNYPCNLNYMPQITTSFTHPTYDDTLNWVQFSSNFIASGGEQFMTIGNFASDDSTVSHTVGGPYNGAYYFVDDVSLIDCSVGIKELNSVYNVTVFPNPTKDNLTISVDKAGVFDITIVDIMNREKQTKQFENSTSLNLQALDKGIYFYELRKKTELIKKGKIIID
jgi:Secretion system C-terminal sorting domain